MGSSSWSPLENSRGWCREKPWSYPTCNWCGYIFTTSLSITCWGPFQGFTCLPSCVLCTQAEGEPAARNKALRQNLQCEHHRVEVNLERVHVRLWQHLAQVGGLGKDPRTAAKDKCTTVALGTSLHLSGFVYKTDDIIVCWGYSEKILEMEWLKQRWYCLIILKAVILRSKCPQGGCH